MIYFTIYFLPTNQTQIIIKQSYESEHEAKLGLKEIALNYIIQECGKPFEQIAFQNSKLPTGLELDNNLKPGKYLKELENEIEVYEKSMMKSSWLSNYFEVEKLGSYGIASVEIDIPPPSPCSVCNSQRVRKKKKKEITTSNVSLYINELKQVLNDANMGLRKISEEVKSDQISTSIPTLKVQAQSQINNYKNKLQESINEYFFDKSPTEIKHISELTTNFEENLEIPTEIKHISELTTNFEENLEIPTLVTQSKKVINKKLIGNDKDTIIISDTDDESIDCEQPTISYSSCEYSNDASIDYESSDSDEESSYNEPKNEELSDEDSTYTESSESESESSESESSGSESSGSESSESESSESESSESDYYKKKTLIKEKSNETYFSSDEEIPYEKIPSDTDTIDNQYNCYPEDYEDYGSYKYY